MPSAEPEIDAKIERLRQSGWGDVVDDILERHVPRVTDDVWMILARRELLLQELDALLRERAQH